MATRPRSKARATTRTQFAYLRDVRQYRNLLLAEQPNGDFARTIVRQFFYSAFADLHWRAMMASTDTTLSAIAAKSEKESAYHLRHCSEWVVRLGDGTAESHRRAQTAIDDLWAFTGEMFAVDDSERGLIEAGIAVDPASLRARWLKTVTDVIGEATLVVPQNDWMQQGGRIGHHSEHLGHLLSELQSMQRSFPGADMVMLAEREADLRQRAWDAAAGVVDPEIPVLTIADLGVLREVTLRDDGSVEVAITPTYSGCPAMSTIAFDIAVALERAGFADASVRTVLSPAWTTDWMSEDGRRKLKAYGIAPPLPASSRRALFGIQQVHARNAAPARPSCCRNSARPPARRYGAARAAASRSIISSVIDVR